MKDGATCDFRASRGACSAACRVVNLSTGAERFYCLPPVESVRAAWLQARGDWSTWEYARRSVPLVRGTRTVAAGDWCAML